MSLKGARRILPELRRVVHIANFCSTDVGVFQHDDSYRSYAKVKLNSRIIINEDTKKAVSMY